MTRKKLNLAYITNDSMRKASFYKRKKGFVKKIHELSVLCGIGACAVIHSPFSSIPEMWPSHSGVKEIVEKFEMVGEMDQDKKMVNHETFIRQNISKTMESNNKRIKDNAERTMKEAMFQHLDGNGDKLKLSNRNRADLCEYIDQYLKELVHHKNTILNHQSHLEHGESSSSAMALATIAEVGSSSLPNPNVCNDSLALRPIVCSQQINTLTSNFSSTVPDQQGYYQVSVYDQQANFNHPNHNQYQQQFEYQIMAQDGVYNANQDQNQQEDRIKSPKQMGDNNSYYNHQP